MSILDLSSIRTSPYRYSTSLRNSPRCTSRSTNINNLNFILQKSSLTSKSTCEESHRLPHVNRIRNRTKKQPGLEITPELAVQVVQKFLLPMFESDNRKKSAHNRTESFGLNRSMRVQKDDSCSLFPSISCSPSRPMTTATVYQELKLSEQLMSELNELRSELTQKEQNLNSAIQDKMSVTIEHDLLMNKYLELSTYCESLKIANDNDRKDSQKYELRYTMMSSQNIEYKRLCRDLKKQTDELKQNLQEEKVINDKLRDTKIHLENGNSLLTMENQVMGEMLRKLYETIGNLTGIHSVPTKLTQEYTELLSAAESVADHYSKLDEGVKNLAKARDSLQAEAEFMLVNRNALINEKDWLHKTYKQQISNLQRELQDANDSRSKLADDLSKLDMAHRNLNVEYKLLLKRMRSIKKRANYDQAEEKHCKNCAKIFIDSENYNWSCRNHLSTYSGEIWWCCGKTNKDAPGCKISKHESKHDDADLYESEKNENTKYRTNICSSCRSIGHSSHQCPKDPNARYTIDYQEELNRLHGIDKSKHHFGPDVSDIQFKAMDMVACKMSNSGFVQDSLSELSDFEEGEGEKLASFNDIASFKKVAEIDKAHTLVTVDEFLTKEIQRESLTLRSKLGATAPIDNMTSYANRPQVKRTTKTLPLGVSF